MRYLEQSNPQDRQQNGGLSGGGRRQSGELLFNMLRVAVCKDEKVLDNVHTI